MKWPRRVLSTRGKVLPVAVFTFGAAFLLYSATLSSTTTVASADSFTTPPEVSAPAATFPGTGVGAIPDGGSGCGPSPGAARDVTFTAAGLSGSPTAVDINMTFGSPVHTFIGDVSAILIAPNGASHTVFARTGATTATAFGGSSDLGATYNFSDTAPAPPSGGWWQEETVRGAAEIMTAGTYRTTASGGAGATNPQPPTSINAAFAAVPNANGTWTLRLTDGCGADTGAITAANLTITAGPAVPHDANVDINGDGKTDYVVARGTNTPLSEASGSGNSPIANGNYSALDQRPAKRIRGADSAVPQAPPIYWYTALNGPGTTSVTQLGDAATDFIISEDFDGDSKDDLVVWTEAAATVANFKILRSSTMTVDTQVFGQTDDDPAVVGDYDGDGKADPAVYRCPVSPAPDGQCYFFYRGSNANPSGNITYVPWGFGADGDFFPYVGDMDGDGKNDFCIQAANPSSPSSGLFYLLKSGGGVEYIGWGLSSDFLIPGDYDGDGKTDICVRRTVGGVRQHWILTRTGATSMSIWGVTGDSSVPGDYDGDGKTDLAIWRGNADPTQNFFWVQNSSTGSTSVVEWGQCPAGACDFAVAGWLVH